MVHAEASNFPSRISKQDAYARILEEAEALFSEQRNWHAYKSLPDPSNQVNWAGFYTLDPLHPSQLILGPFQGKVACQTIAFGCGVCGTAAAEKKTVRVRDVEEFPGHIACDAESKSEIVVPVVWGGQVAAIIDIDCGAVGGFDEVDEAGLENLAALVARSCNWSGN